MKKNPETKPKRLALSRETLRLLAEENLKEAAGGTILSLSGCCGSNNTGCRPDGCVIF